METTEKIVESCGRYVKGWFTISNIKCSGQYEIDLLAVTHHLTPTLNVIMLSAVFLSQVPIQN